MPATYTDALIEEYKQTVLQLTDEVQELHANVNVLKTQAASLQDSNVNLLLNVETKRSQILDLQGRISVLEDELTQARTPKFQDTAESDDVTGYGDEALRMAELVLTDSVDFIKKSVAAEVSETTKALATVTEELRTVRNQSKSQAVRTNINSLCLAINDFRVEVEKCFLANAVCIVELTWDREDSVCRWLSVRNAYDKLCTRFDSAQAIVRGASLSSLLSVTRLTLQEVVGKLLNSANGVLNLTTMRSVDMQVADCWVKYFTYNVNEKGLTESVANDPAKFCSDLCLCLKARTGWLFTDAAFDRLRAGAMKATEDALFDFDLRAVE